MSEDFELVMPFLTVTSKGGPHEDAAYAAGWECGQIDTLLDQAGPGIYERPVRVENLPQIDLIAMHHGYTLTTEPLDGYWTTAVFAKESQ